MADSNIRIKVQADDGGASAILKRITELLGTLTAEQRKGIQVTAQERSEAERLAESQRRSEAAIRARATSLKQQTAALKEAAAAFREHANANAQMARAQQQTTQAMIQDSRLQRQAIDEQTKALREQTAAEQQRTRTAANSAAQRTRAALQANANDVKAINAQTQSMIQSAAQASKAQQQATQQAIASQKQQSTQQNIATQAAISGAAQQTRAIQQGTQAQLTATRATTAALQQQTRAQLALTNATNRAAAAQIAAANKQAAAVTAASRVQVAQIRAQQQILHDAAQYRLAQLQVGQSTQQNIGLVDALTKRFFALAASLFAVRRLTQGFLGFVREGFKFNETINQATLGIGALITAQAKLYDSQGQLLQGSRALDAAMKLSEQQVTQLRIAGLQTAATTEQLVTAFQQAVGPGLRSGLNLDQIRQFTVDITQAAAAIGLPMHQLNEEVRSLLAGTITYNTRIAKTLGITNEMVSAWKQQGVFADRLLERFKSFNLAGERAMSNMTVLLSNLKEAFQVFAGEATKPLFDRLRKEGQAALNQFFDFDRGKISVQFQGIIDIARNIFSSIAGLLGSAIRASVQAALDLSDYFDKNRVAIEGVVDSAKDLTIQVAKVLGNVIKIVLSLIDAGIKTGFLQGLFQTLANLTRIVADNIKIIEIIFAAGVLFKGIAAIASLLAIGPVGAAIALVAGSLVLVGAALSGMNDEVERGRREQEILDNQNRNRAVEIHNLAVQYGILQKEIASGKLSTAALAIAKEKLQKIVQQLIRYAPQYSHALSQWGVDAKETAEQVRKLEQAQIDLLNTQFKLARARQLALREQKQSELRIAETLEASARMERKGGHDDRADADEERAKAARKNLVEFQKQLDRADAEVGGIINAMAVLVGTEKDLLHPTKIVPDKATDDGKTKKNNDFKQMIEAAIKEVQDAFKRAKDALDDELDHQQISFADYIAQVLDAERKAVNAEIVLRRTLLAHTTDPGDRAKIEADINILVNKRIGLAEDARRKLTDMEKQLNDDLQQIDLQRLRQEDQNGEARRIELELQYQKLRRVAEANKKDLSGLDTFINVEVARAKLEDVQRMISRATSQAQSRIDNINALASKGLITTMEQARFLADAYNAQIAAIEKALPTMRALAEASRNPDAIENVRQLEIELAKLIEQQRLATSAIARYTETALEGFQSGVTDSFSQIGTQIEETHKHFDKSLGKMVEETTTRMYGLRDVAKDVSLSILRSLQQQLAQEFSQNITSMLRGALSRVGIHIGGDMSAAVAQQQAATTQVSAATTNAAAATQFAASIGLLQGLVPGMVAVAQGGGATAAAVDSVVGDGLDTAPLVTGATALQAAGSSLVGASAALSGALVAPAGALSASAAALSAAAAALSASATAGGAFGGNQTVSKINSFASAALASGGQTGVTRSFPGSTSGPLLSRAITTNDSVNIMPSLAIPQVSSPRTASFSRAAEVVPAQQQSLAPSRVEVLLRPTDDHVLRVMKSDPGVNVQVDNMRRRRRTTRGILG